jgi:hypothetical protein
MGGALAEASRFRRERVKTFRADVLAMEAIRKTLKRMVVERGFEPGRLRHTSMATAYERLVPIHRAFLRQEPNDRRHAAREECLCAR